MDITHEDYEVKYHSDTATVMCQGSLRLRGTEEYAPILGVLTQAADAQPAVLTLDLRALAFLNTLGIHTLSKFVLYVRHLGVSQMVVQGNSHVAWQQKSLQNLQRLLPSLQLEMT